MDFTCGGCPTKWSGHNMAHCSVCHETFGSVRNFDKHRVDGQCLTPTQIGLTYNETNRAWTKPLSDAEAKRLDSLR